MIGDQEEPVAPVIAAVPHGNLVSVVAEPGTVANLVRNDRPSRDRLSIWRRLVQIPHNAYGLVNASDHHEASIARWIRALYIRISAPEESGALEVAFPLDHAVVLLLVHPDNLVGFPRVIGVDLDDAGGCQPGARIGYDGVSVRQSIGAVRMIGEPDRRSPIRL